MHWDGLTHNFLFPKHKSLTRTIKHICSSYSITQANAFFLSFNVSESDLDNFIASPLPSFPHGPLSLPSMTWNMGKDEELRPRQKDKDLECTQISRFKEKYKKKECLRSR